MARAICATSRRVREAGAVVVALVEHEHLGLVGQAAEGGGVHDAVAVALEGGAHGAGGLGVHAAGGVLGPRCPGRERREPAARPGPGHAPHQPAVLAVAAMRQPEFEQGGRLSYVVGEESRAQSLSYPKRPASGNQMIAESDRATAPMTTASTLEHPVKLSERAARRIAEIVAAEPATPLLRVSVEGGGCSGFQYKFDLVAPPRPMTW